LTFYQSYANIHYIPTKQTKMMPNYNSPPPVEGQQYQRGPLDQPVQPGQEDAVDLELAEMLIATRPEVLVLMGSGLVAQALLEEALLDQLGE
jgi:hypothetical protein